MTDAYARAGVDVAEADRAVAALVDVLRTIDPGRPSRSLVGSGHFAAVLEIAPGLGLALCTDGVGSKLIVAEATGRFDTVGIDCVAMNVNDLVCVGAEPVALVDYLAVEQADPEMLAAIGRGLKAGAEQAGIEIPGGELAQVPELIRGHPSPRGFDLNATAVGIVAADRILTGEACAPGDALIGLPSSGIHSNGYTLARRALREDGGLSLDDRPEELGGASVADALLEPTAIYVRAVLELLRSDVPVHGLAHITGGGLANLLRLNESVGFAIESPLPVPPIFELIQRLGSVDEAEMWDVFNMGCGFVAVVPVAQADAAVQLLAAHHPGAARIGTVTSDAGAIRRKAVSEEDVAVVRRVVEAWQREDLDAWLSGLDPDVEWHTVLERVVEGPESFYSGHEGARRLWHFYRDELDDFEFEAEEIRSAAEGRVLLLGRFRWRGLASGIASESPIGMVITMRDGKMLESTDYLSHQEALDAVGLAE